MFQQRVEEIRGACRSLSHETNTSSFEEFRQRVKETEVTAETIDVTAANFPSELRVAITNDLVARAKWEASDRVIEDVIGEIAHLTKLADDKFSRATLGLQTPISEDHFIRRNFGILGGVDAT
jgi:hypothetical protein